MVGRRRPGRGQWRCVRDVAARIAVLPAERARPGALRRDRRRRHVRHRADHARPRASRSPAATPRTPSSLTALRALGATVHVGHDAGATRRRPTRSSSRRAIREDNPELVEARRRGLRCCPGPPRWPSVMAGRRAVAVAGTHGKTTTTSMLTVALQHCGADPSFAIGGNLNESGANAHDGSGDVFVAEADESDGSFLLYAPDGGDRHQRRGRPPRPLRHARRRRAGLRRVRRPAPAERVPGRLRRRPGRARGCAERSRARGIDVRTYGESAERRRAAWPTWSPSAARGPASSWSIAAGARVGSRLRLPGRHNALNAAAALTAGPRSRASARGELRDGLAGFTGTRRRFELKGYAGGVRVYDDYAHHPTEVAADLAAARAVAGDGRVVVVFQPHLFSRTQAFAAEFGERARARRRGRRDGRVRAPRGPGARRHRRDGRRGGAAAAPRS